MPTRRRPVMFLLLAVLGLAACGPGTASVAPGSSATTAAPSVVVTTGSPKAVASDGGAQAGQTDTDWGRIWDSLPKGFPAYRGSTSGEEATTGAASAVIGVQTADAKGIATFFQTALQNAGYATDGLSGPLEDGSYVLDMTGPPAGCELQVRAAPTGGLTTVTILYGASCPLT